jgi:hypothetical protein
VSLLERRSSGFGEKTQEPGDAKRRVVPVVGAGRTCPRKSKRRNSRRAWASGARRNADRCRSAGTRSSASPRPARSRRRGR